MTHLPDNKNGNPWPTGGGVDWAQVWPENRRWLATVLLARGVEAGAVEEVLQEVGAAAVAGADKLRDVRKVSPWLYRIAVLKALQYRRRLGRRRKLIDRYANSREEGFDRTEADPLDWLLAEEQKQLVRQALATLSPRDAEIMLLKYTEGWSYRQLAEHVGVSESAVEARLHRARGKMRKALARLVPELSKQ